MVCSICTTGVMTLGGKSSSLSRFGLASKERLPNCAHRHPELMNGHSHPHHWHWQIAESRGRHKKEDHHKQCKLTAHPDTASLSFALENNMSVDHTATRIELAMQPKTECLSMPTFDAFVVMSAQNCPCHVCQSSQNNRICQHLPILSSDPLILTTSTESLL